MEDGNDSASRRLSRSRFGKEQAMAARAYWQGQIRLALVSIPVELYPATKSGATVAFRQIHEPSGKPIHYEKVVTGIGPVDPDEILKGYEVSKGNYVLLEQDEIDAVKLESKKTLELTQFVDLGDIDPIYYDKPYYVVPADDLAEEAFIVLREALRQTRKIGLGQLAMRGREYVVSLKPCGRGMVLETLRYADEVNKATPFFRDIGDAKPQEDLLDLATTLIEKKTGEFDASEFHDRYVDALKDLIERKRKGRKIATEEEDAPAQSRGSNVIDLMAALKKSLEKPGARASTASSSRGTAKKPASRARRSTPARKPAVRKRA
jgi:DNA end-binding protein Ku